MEKPEEKNKKQLTRSRPNNLKSAIGTVVTLLVLACIISLILCPIYGFNYSYLILAIVLFFAANCVNSIQVVQRPERWIIERFGNFHRIIGPGVHWTIPWIETIRKQLSLTQQQIDGFQSIDEIDFRDGRARLLNPKLWIELDEINLQNTIYNLEDEDYKSWAESVSGPIVRGYLNSLTIDEALDEGAARGDVLDKIRTRPQVTETRIEEMKSFIGKLSRKINEIKRAGKDASLLEAAKETKEEDKKLTERVLSEQDKAKDELKTFEDQAQGFGIKKVVRFTVGEFLISDELKNAREGIHKARKDLIATASKAISEAMMRTEPIVRATERFKQVGFSKKEAREKAFMIDVIETLSKEHNLFLTGGQGDIRSLAAQIAAIFTETTQRRKEALAETKEQTKN